MQRKWFIRPLTPYNVSVRPWASCAVELISGLELIPFLFSCVFISRPIFKSNISLKSRKYALFNDLPHLKICPAVKEL